MNAATAIADNGALGKCDVSVDDGLQIDDADEGTALERRRLVSATKNPSTAFSLRPDQRSITSINRPAQRRLVPTRILVVDKERWRIDGDLGNTYIFRLGTILAPENRY
jgi:hypothetical protein